VTDEVQDVLDAVWRFPHVAAEHAQTHGALFVVGDIWVVDLGLEGDDGWLEGVFLWQRDFEDEFTALRCG